MENQVALITGAQGGLGTFVTAAFLEAGAQVVGTSREIEEKEPPLHVRVVLQVLGQ